MKQYYYSDGQERFGPFTLEELHAKSLSKDTLIWYEELDDWKKAGDLPELAPLFEMPAASPPFSQSESPSVTPSSPSVLDSSTETKPKTWLVESILVTILCCLPFGIAGIINAAKVDSRYAAGDYVGAKKSSDEAKKWTIIGLIAGVVVMLLYFAWFGLTMMGVMNEMDSMDY